MKDKPIYYRVGALLYCPANHAGFVDSLEQESFGRFFSMSLCLEDTIRDDQILAAEQKLIGSLQSLHERAAKKSFYLPFIFIRVRQPDQIKKLICALGEASSLVTGFILPKFSLSTADGWLAVMGEINAARTTPFYLMPIFESPELIRLDSRNDILYTLKEKLDRQGETVLNIRVGGNDLSHAFGLRRANNQTIYDVLPVASILTDLLTVFSMDYVVSGPVWEYYRGEGWDTGLRRELERDRLSGFTGKTVIHPNQIKLVNQAYQVSAADAEDARAILGWDDGLEGLVNGSAAGERMNEYNTHFNWAKRTQMLAQVYGVAGEQRC